MPEGLREGPQDHMDVQIDTTNLDPGMYQLLIAQQDDKSHPVRLNILSDPAKVTNFPVLVNQGVATQHFVLKGERLGNLAKLETPGAKLELGDISNNGTERSITVQLTSNLKPGTLLPVAAYLQGRANPENVSSGLQITGPLPVIASSKPSLPTGLAITTNPNEFPAGSTLTAVLDVKNIERKSVLQLFCQDDTSPRAALQIGERTSSQSLQQLSPDQLFLSYNTTALPAGCNLQAVINNGRDGKSQAFDLARIVLMPQIDSFSAKGTAPDNATAYTIVGQNLEIIQKVGWDQTNGADVPGLPNPIPGQGQKQSLTVNLPTPPISQPCLFLWLRGDDQGRITTIKPILAVPPSPMTIPAKTPTENQQSPMSSAAVNGPPRVL